ncbi:MAG: LLM class oxidoreductase [Bacteroidota bacterium]
MKKFEQINRAFNSVFQPNQLSLGVVIPIENYAQSPVPSMKDHLKRAKLVEGLGFKALWVRDVPFNVPSFGDAGQTFDPFTYLGYLAGQTSEIALVTGSIALPLHHPVHVAKSAATIDQLSGGRLILGVASGDRPTEYPAMGIEFEKRDNLFRDAFQYIRKAQESFPTSERTHFGVFNGQMDILPKPTTHKIPILVTGHSRQSLDWIAKYSDGWIYYPRNLYMQTYNTHLWRDAVAKTQDYDKPFAQSLYIDLHHNDDFAPQPIHLGFRLGIHHLIEHLHHLREIGVNHVTLNLRFNSRGIEETLEQLATQLLPQFHLATKTTTSV